MGSNSPSTGRVKSIRCVFCPSGVCWAALSSPPPAPVLWSIRAESSRSLPPVYRGRVRAPRAVSWVSLTARFSSDLLGCVRWTPCQTASDHGILIRYTMRWETVIYAVLIIFFLCIIICKNAVLKPVAVVGLCGAFIWTRLEHMAHSLAHEQLCKTMCSTATRKTQWMVFAS